MSPTWPQEEQDHFTGGLRVPLSADHLSWENDVDAECTLVCKTKIETATRRPPSSVEDIRGGQAIDMLRLELWIQTWN